VLLLVCDPGEQAILQQTLAPHAELTWVCTPEELSQQLEECSFDVVVCARRLCLGSWRGVLEEVRQFNPNLPVIIHSQSTSEEEWEEVLAAGAFDLLGVPYYDQEPLFMLEHAVASYEARLRQNSARVLTRKAS
jgi:DNA-binding NtrC family response regulator